MKAIEVSSALAFEHFVMGQGNKPTLIGLYTGDIVVAEFPATIWLGFYIDIKKPKSGRLEELKLELRVGDRMAATFVVGVPGEWPTDTATLTLPSGILNIEGPCTIEMIGTAEGFAPTRFISKRVLLGVFPPDGPPSIA